MQGEHTNTCVSVFACRKRMHCLASVCMQRRCSCVCTVFLSAGTGAAIRIGARGCRGSRVGQDYVCKYMWVGDAGVWRGWKINRWETHFPSPLLRQYQDSINEQGLRFPGNAYEWEQVGNCGDSAKRGIASCHGNAMNRDRPSRVKVASDLWDLNQCHQSSKCCTSVGQQQTESPCFSVSRTLTWYLDN